MKLRGKCCAFAENYAAIRYAENKQIGLRLRQNGRQEIAFLIFIGPSPRRACAEVMKGTGFLGAMRQKSRRCVLRQFRSGVGADACFLRARRFVERWPRMAERCS